MALRTLTTAVLLGTATLFGSAQAGSINDDINRCRSAIDEAGLFGDTEYNLDFVKDYGKRNRVITLEANLVGQEDRTVECRMNRSKIKEVVLVEG